MLCSEAVAGEGGVPCGDVGLFWEFISGDGCAVSAIEGELVGGVCSIFSVLVSSIFKLFTEGESFLKVENGDGILLLCLFRLLRIFGESNIS